MKKYIILCMAFFAGCATVPNVKSNIDTKQKLADFDSCVDVYNEARLDELYFENTQQALRFFPKLLDKDNVPVLKYNRAYFNMACGGTALTGQVTTQQKQGKTWIQVKTCGDLSWQSEKDACSIDKGYYQQGLKTKDGETIILKYGYIFYINNDGVVSAYKISQF